MSAIDIFASIVAFDAQRALTNGNGLRIAKKLHVDKARHHTSTSVAQNVKLLTNESE